MRGNGAPAARIRHTSKIGAAAAALALVVAACGSSGKSSTPPASTASATSAAAATTTSVATGVTTAGSAGGGGITATSITVGQLADVSGPIPGLFQGAVDGLDAWAAYVNSTGGIDGRKIVIDHKDSALSCTNYKNGLTSIAKSDFASVGSLSVVDVCGEQVLKANPGFPDIQASLQDPNSFDYPNVYTPQPQPAGWETTGYQWVATKYGAAAVSKAAALYGTVDQHQFNDENQAAKAAGYKFLYTRGVGATETNFTSDILRMKAAGVKVADISLFTVNQVAGFLQQAAQQNFHPDAIINQTAYDPSFFKLLGNAADAKALVIPLNVSLYLGQDNGTVPEIGTMTQWAHKTHPKDQVNLYTVYAWAAGLLFQEAMAHAGANPTQAGLLSGVKGVTHFTGDGLFASDSPGGKVPPDCVVIAGVANGNFVRVDPPSTGFTCKQAGYHYATGGAS